MHQRCYDPKHKSYKHYGAKGVTVCERWHDIANFIADMGSRRPARTSLDRIDPTRGYSPDNCRWATNREQIRHRSNTVVVSYGGKQVSLADALEQEGIVFTTKAMQPYKRAYARLRCGWTVERVVIAAKNEKGAGA